MLEGTLVDTSIVANFFKQRRPASLYQKKPNESRIYGVLRSRELIANPMSPCVGSMLRLPPARHLDIRQ